jgi:hypothetical protein
MCASLAVPSDVHDDARREMQLKTNMFGLWSHIIFEKLKKVSIVDGFSSHCPSDLDHVGLIKG